MRGHPDDVSIPRESIDAVTAEERQAQALYDADIALRSRIQSSPEFIEPPALCGYCEKPTVDPRAPMCGLCWMSEVREAKTLVDYLP